MSGERASPAADVFSFGIVLWELCTLELPWSKTNTYQVGDVCLRQHAWARACVQGCLQGELPGSLAVSPACVPLLQIISLVLGGGRMEIPARERLPGPDTHSFAGGEADQLRTSSR
jgi:serine/threonine protein kinase